MVVSFKIARIGTRYRPKPRPEPESSSGPELNYEDEVDARAKLPEIQSSTSRKRSVNVMEDYRKIAESSGIMTESKVSFILNIFENGYTIANASENNDWRVHDDLRPFDRRSESMITAIECGYLPTYFLDDIECTYVNGRVLCEVRDYRRESCKSAAEIPCIKKVSLKMTLNDVVKDINMIYDDTWEYGDVLEMESRILLALQPKLNLDPTPNFERLHREPTSVELNLDIRGMRLKRLRPASEPESSKSSEPENIEDHFSKIRMLTARYNLNCKINKIEDDHKSTIHFSSQQLKHALSNNQDNDIVEVGPCKMPLSMSLKGGNINICKSRVLNFELKEPQMAENESAARSKFYTGLILSERQSDGTVAIHHGDLDAIDYLPDDQLLTPLKNTHMADLLGNQFGDLMLREGYKAAGDHLKSKPVNVVLSVGGQPDTTPEDFNKWLLQIMKDDPRELVYELDEPPSQHNVRPQSVGSNPGVSTARTRPCVVHSYWESQNRPSHQRERSQIQRPTNVRPGGHHFSTVGFQGLGMGQNQTATRGRIATKGLSPLSGRNPTATRQVMGQSSGSVRQTSNFGGLLQGVNRQIHLGSGSGSSVGSGSESGSSGVSMLGSGTGINRGGHMVQMTQNRYMNLQQQQQQLQLIKQEPTSDLRAVSGLGSGPSGVMMLGSGSGTNRGSDMNAMQMAQNHHMNQQQLQQEPTYNWQAVSGSGSGASCVIIPGSGAGLNRASDINTMQMAQNRYMNQHQLQSIIQPTSHLQAVSGSGSGPSGVMIPGSGTGINMVSDVNAMQMVQNRYMNLQQFQQAVSGSGSGSSGVVMLGPGACINRANDMNVMQTAQNCYMNQQQFQQEGSGLGSGPSSVIMLGSNTGINNVNDMERNFMACLSQNQNHFINQQQFQLLRQPTSNLLVESGSGSGSGPSGVLMLGPGTGIKRPNEMN